MPLPTSGSYFLIGEPPWRCHAVLFFVREKPVYYYTSPVLNIILKCRATRFLLTEVPQLPRRSRKGGGFHECSPPGRVYRIYYSEIPENSSRLPARLAIDRGLGFPFSYMNIVWRSNIPKLVACPAYLRLWPIVLPATPCPAEKSKHFAPTAADRIPTWRSSITSGRPWLSERE